MAKWSGLTFEKVNALMESMGFEQVDSADSADSATTDLVFANHSLQARVEVRKVTWLKNKVVREGCGLKVYWRYDPVLGSGLRSGYSMGPQLTSEIQDLIGKVTFVKPVVVKTVASTSKRSVVGKRSKSQRNRNAHKTIGVSAKQPILSRQGISTGSRKVWKK